MSVPQQTIKVRGYTIRPARPSDVERLVELLVTLQDHLEAANPDLWRMTDEARKELKGQLAARLTASSSCVLVAEHQDDGVIGVILGRILTNHRYTPARTGIIDQTFVRKDHRRLGIGSCLVAALCHFFAAEGIEDLSLRYVVGNQEAAQFWEALGFTPRIIVVGASRQVIEVRLQEGAFQVSG